MDHVQERLRWGVRRRLEFIDFRLFWDGRFNRSDMAKTFGISPQQASADVGQYQKIAPGNVTYDPSQKTYKRTDQFEAAFIGNVIEPHLLQLIAIESGWLNSEDTWFHTIPPIEAISLRRKPIAPEVLMHILDAVHNRMEVDIHYGSLTGSIKPIRTIAPHALCYSTGRWYIRSWSKRHNDFREYSLNRIATVANPRPSRIDPVLDFEWVHVMNLVIIPNPILPLERQDTVAWEHGMTDRRLVFPCRLSLSFHLMSEHNLDVDPGVLDPAKQQIVLENREEVLQARAIARRMSIQALERSRGTKAE